MLSRYSAYFLYYTQTDAYDGQVSDLDDLIDLYNQMDIEPGDPDLLDSGQEGLMKEQQISAAIHGIREFSKTSSEDSGVDMNTGTIGRRDDRRPRLERKRSGKGVRENGNGSTAERVTWADLENPHRVDTQDFDLPKKKGERQNNESQRQKMLQKRYSERIISNEQDLVGSKKVHAF